MGTPKESAQRSRDYLRSIESNFTANQLLASAH
jgi:hypothetical protein